MAIKQKEEDDEHARQVAKEGMVGTEDLYDLKAQEKAAIKLEAIARGKRDRKMVKHMKEDRAQEKAAIKLEAAARGKRDRKKVKQMREEKAKMKEKEAQEENEAATAQVLEKNREEHSEAAAQAEEKGEDDGVDL